MQAVILYAGGSDVCKGCISVYTWKLLERLVPRFHTTESRTGMKDGVDYEKKKNVRLKLPVRYYVGEFFFSSAVNF